MPTSIAFYRRALLHFRRKKAFRLINGNLVETARFERKRTLLNAIGHEVGNHARRADKGLNENITIGNGCWIGQRVLLAHGAKIPDGCVIAAGAVVIGHKDFEPDTLIGGVPAKTIKHYKDGKRGE